MAVTRNHNVWRKETLITPVEYKNVYVKRAIKILRWFFVQGVVDITVMNGGQTFYCSLSIFASSRRNVCLCGSLQFKFCNIIYVWYNSCHKWW